MIARLLSIDTETTLIPERKTIRSRAGDPINTGPFVVPTLVLGSIAWDKESKVMTPDGLTLFLNKVLREVNTHLVLHNLIFDYQVLCQASPELRQPFEEAAIAGRLHDTMLLDLLLGLAQGRFDKPKYRPESKTWAPEEPKYRSLEKLAWDYCGMQLNKDPAIRLGYGQFLGRPLSEVPPDFIEYAKQDAVATLRVYEEQQRLLLQLGAQHNLSEGLQIRAAIALRGLDQVGVAIDRPLAGKLEASFLAEQRPLEIALVAAGIGRWEPKKGTKQTRKVPK